MCCWIAKGTYFSISAPAFFLLPTICRTSANWSSPYFQIPFIRKAILSLSQTIQLRSTFPTSISSSSEGSTDYREQKDETSFALRMYCLNFFYALLIVSTSLACQAPRMMGLGSKETSLQLYYFTTTDVMAIEDTESTVELAAICQLPLATTTDLILGIQ